MHSKSYWFIGTKAGSIEDKDEIKSKVELLVVKFQTLDHSNKEIENSFSNWLSVISLSSKIRQLHSFQISHIKHKGTRFQISDECVLKFWVCYVFSLLQGFFCIHFMFIGYGNFWHIFKTEHNKALIFYILLAVYVSCMIYFYNIWSK